MNSPVREQYRRHIFGAGVTFQTKHEYVEAVRRQCRIEYLDARSAEGLDRFLARLAELISRVDDEVRAHRALGQVVSSLEAAARTAAQLAPDARSAPWTMVSTRVLARMAHALEELRAGLNSQLNLRATDSLSEHGGMAPDGEDGFLFCLSNWSAALRDVSWAKHPGHRELVFLALRHTGELGGRRAFRFLAVASLVSGGELITFRPNRTTVAEAIAYEAKRMREVALQLDLSWAADLPIDEVAVEPVGPELQFDDADGPDEDSEPVDMPHVDEAA